MKIRFKKFNLFLEAPSQSQNQSLLLAKNKLFSLMNGHVKVTQKEVRAASNIDKWIILFGFSLNSFSNVFSYGVFLVIWQNLADYFNTTREIMDWLSNYYLITAILISFPINPFIIKNFGASQIVSCLLTAGGLWIMSLSHSDYIDALFSLTLIGLGQCAFFQVPLYLSKLWFEPQERIMSTFIGQYINSIGTLVGYCVSACEFYDVSQQELNDKLENLMTINAVFASVAVILNLFALKKNSRVQQFEFRENIKDSMIKVFASIESVFDLFSVATSITQNQLVIGWGWSYTMFFNQLQSNLGQTYLDQVLVSVAFQIGSIVAAFICTLKLTKQSRDGLQPSYDTYIKYTLGIGFSFLSIQINLYNYLPPILLAILNLFIGGGLGGLYSLFLESLMEKHYPIQELTIATVLFIVASVEGMLMNFILKIPYFSNFGFLISCFFLIAPFCYIMIFYETKYKRFESEG